MEKIFNKILHNKNKAQWVVGSLYMRSFSGCQPNLSFLMHTQEIFDWDTIKRFHDQDASTNWISPKGKVQFHTV